MTHFAKIEESYNSWVSSLNVQAPHPLDDRRFYELAYQVYLARHNKESDWQAGLGATWLREKLEKDGRFSPQQIDQHTFKLEDLVDYSDWLVERNGEA